MYILIMIGVLMVSLVVCHKLVDKPLDTMLHNNKTMSGVNTEEIFEAIRKELRFTNLKLKIGPLSPSSFTRNSVEYDSESRTLNVSDGHGGRMTTGYFVAYKLYYAMLLRNTYIPVARADVIFALTFIICFLGYPVSLVLGFLAIGIIPFLRLKAQTQAYRKCFFLFDNIRGLTSLSNKLAAVTVLEAWIMMVGFAIIGMLVFELGQLFWGIFL